jgi:hypothetical protein
MGESGRLDTSQHRFGKVEGLKCDRFVHHLFLFRSHLGLFEDINLARIIHGRSVFVNNAPAGAGSAAPAGFDRPLTRPAQG